MTDGKMKALVLAAGKSTRIASISGGIPKPLLEIGEIPVLAHNLKLLSQYGIKEVWINLHYQSDLVRQTIGDGKKWGVSVRYSFEKDILGTAGAVKNLEKEFSNGAFLVLYGDNFTSCNLEKLINEHKKRNAFATIALFDSLKNKNSGIAGGKISVDQEGWIKSFVEGGGDSHSNEFLVNAGIYALEPEILNDLPEGFSDFGKDIFPKLVEKKKKILGYKIEGYCLALDTPEAFQNAQKVYHEFKSMR